MFGIFADWPQILYIFTYQYLCLVKKKAYLEVPQICPWISSSGLAIIINTVVTFQKYAFKHISTFGLVLATLWCG